MKALEDSQLTVRRVDPKMKTALLKEAKRKKESLNKAVLRLLRTALGLGAREGKRAHEDLNHLSGRWSRKQYDTFTAHLGHQRRIDHDLWK